MIMDLIYLVYYLLLEGLSQCMMALTQKGSFIWTGNILLLLTTLNFSSSHFFFSCQQPYVKRNIFEMRINPLNLPTLLLLKWFSRTQKTLRQGYLKKENRHKNVKKKADKKKKKKKKEKKKKKKKQQNKKQTSIQRRANASFP